MLQYITNIYICMCVCDVFIYMSFSFISFLATKDLMESQEEVKEEGLGYVVMRNLFSRDSDYQLKLVKKSRSITMRESAEKLALTKKVMHLYVFCSRSN